MREEKLPRLMTEFGRLLSEHAAFRDIFGPVEGIGQVLPAIRPTEHKQMICLFLRVRFIIVSEKDAGRRILVKRWKFVEES